jgi:CheY-like chemotaxis protein
MSSAKDALRQVTSDAADVAILDFDMPDIDGGLLASLLKQRCPTLPVILYSGNTQIPRSAQDCVDAVCPKGIPRENLLAMIQRFARDRVTARAVDC